MTWGRVSGAFSSLLHELKKQEGTYSLCTPTAHAKFKYLCAELLPLLCLLYLHRVIFLCDLDQSRHKFIQRIVAYFRRGIRHHAWEQNKRVHCRAKGTKTRE